MARKLTEIVFLYCSNLRPQWMTNSMEDDQDDIIGRRPQWKTTSLEDNINGRQP